MMSHVERVLPVDDLKRIRDKYASKKPLWGRGAGRGSQFRKYPEEFVGHIKWLMKDGVKPAQIRREFSVNDEWLYRVSHEINFVRVPARRCLHEEVLQKFLKSTDDLL